MKLCCSIALIGLCSLSALQETQAQKTYALGVGGGGSVPVGKLSDSQSPGYNGLIALAVGAPEIPIGIRLDVTYNSFPRRSSVTPPAGTAYAKFRVIGILGNLIYAFPGTSSKAYILAGGGLYNTKSDLSGAKSESNLGFNAGLGFTLALGPWATFFESRYTTISRSVAKGGVVQFVPLTIGLLF